MLRAWRKCGIANPIALDTKGHINRVFNSGAEFGGYFRESYGDRITSLYPDSGFGVFPLIPLLLDDYFLLRHDLVQVCGF